MIYSEDEVLTLLKFHDTLRILGLIEVRAEAIRVAYGAGTKFKVVYE